MLGKEVINLAVPGASNDYIFRNTIGYPHKNTVEAVIVAWTINRLEITKDEDISNTSPDCSRVE